ncbi:MAG: hypothetical protein ABJH98_02060 [Reichenbachiella sp.]|uniref:hypothetical protein n=1 Tax=Reichenbachiella sp. TaxID=2184521 RepID=UPI00329937DF
MQEKSKGGLIISNIYAGIGMGLLMGLIIGLSVSPTVKLVMGSLVGIMGGFLGFENKIGQRDSNENSSLLSNIKLGSFGLAVAGGILWGLTIRTHDLFAPTLSERIQVYTEAGYDSLAARKYVLYEKLGIDPKTGETMKEQGAIQRSNTSALFKSSDTKGLSEQMDPDLWKGNVNKMVAGWQKLNLPTLHELTQHALNILPKEDQLAFLSKIQLMVFQVEENKSSYCQLSDNMMNWEGKTSKEVADLLVTTPYQKRMILVESIKKFFCSIEN